MTAYFKRQLADYVEYHRDPMNCAMHVLGIVVLFLGSLLPLTGVSISLFGAQTSLATILVLPVLVYWLMLDLPIGLAIVGVAAVVLTVAAIIVDHTSTAGMWALTAGLIVVGVASQIIGHPGVRAAAAGVGRQSIASVARADVCDGQTVHCARISAGPRGDHRPRRAASADRRFALCRRPSKRAPRTFMTRILVTGGNGFIGQHLVSELVARDRQVRVLDIRGPHSALPDVDYVQGSVLDQNLLHTAMAGVEQVYHLAGLPGMWRRDRTDFHAVNCTGTENVLAAARKANVAKVMHCSTELILFGVPRPNGIADEDVALAVEQMPGPYTRSKMLADSLALQAAAAGFPVIVACPTMPIGPQDHNSTPPTAMLRHFLANRRLQLYLDFILNLVDVRDVAVGFILAMDMLLLSPPPARGDDLSLKRAPALTAATAARCWLALP